jgi:hypothetical protein
MPTWGPSGIDQLKVKRGVFNLAQNAGTYDLLTATGGDVWVEVEQVFVRTAATGLTSVSIATDHTILGKTILASTLVASLTGDAILSLTTAKFVLPSGKKIQGVIVGTGSAGTVDVVVKWAPLTAGATLA